MSEFRSVERASFSEYKIVNHGVFGSVWLSALHKAGRHMEDSIVAAYIALLLGCVIQDNQVHSTMLLLFIHVHM